MGVELKEAVLRVVEVKGKEIPPIGKVYYGEEIGDGYKEVLLRTVRKRSGTNPDAVLDIVQWYEKPIIQDNGTINPLVCNVQPFVKVFPDCLYPTAIWNISASHLDLQDYIPRWKRYPLTGDSGPLTARGRQIMAFYYCIINSSYVPKELPDGSTDDGHWIMGEPIVGSHIAERTKAMSVLGTDELSSVRRRVG